MSDPVLVHDHPEFEALLSIVSERRGVTATLVEKDYWVTHTLWALEEAGVHKGSGPPRTERLSFKRSQSGSTCRERRWLSSPSRISDALPEGVRPFVQLEVGSARVRPAEDHAISSWVHDHLAKESSEVAAGLTDNRPAAIHCVRPEVTLLEKVEAIFRRYSRDPFEPAGFVRHYEDVARILACDAVAPPVGLRRLLDDMREAGDIRGWPAADDPSLNPAADRERWLELEAAWAAVGPMFWGERITLRDCAREIRGLLRALAR